MKHLLRNLFFFSITLLLATPVFGQTTGKIIGIIADENTEKKLGNVHIFIENTKYTTRSDTLGRYSLSLPTGEYTVVAILDGYRQSIHHQVRVSPGNDHMLNIYLSPQESLKEVNLDEVVIGQNQNVRATDMITPLSVQKLTSQEIRSNPGGNFDVSKVVQSLPGVGLSNGLGERNDIIIRGGAPNENVYYLDGIEIPVLNHFQTQGSSGGAQGILNLAFIDELKLSSSAFDARYNDALSSTFVIRQREGNPSRLSGNLRVSMTESALTLEGPLSSNTTFLASARKSYTGALFKLIDLPIRPEYSDFQYKVSHRFNAKTTLSAIGIGALDNFNFAEPKNATPENQYILRSNPYIKQWTYTGGFILNREIENGYMNFVLSRNMFHTDIDKYEDQQKVEEKRTMQVASSEIENKFRFDISQFIGGWRLTGGVSLQQVSYSGDVFNRIRNAIYDKEGNLESPEQHIQFDSKISFWKYGIFAQGAKRFFDDKLLVSGGVRTDMNTFTNSGRDITKQLSPRLSLSYSVAPRWNINASAGLYYKTPIYTALGYKDSLGSFINQDMEYTQAKHGVLGAEYIPRSSLRFTIEGFYKKYDHYPISGRTGVSMANQGTQYGSVGSERIHTNGQGEAYGVELFTQMKMTKNLFYTLSYSYVVSKFSGADGKLVASSWDNRHLLSGMAGYRLPRNWEIGGKFRFAGGNPYTPFDMAASQQNYLLLGQGIANMEALNTLRLDNYSQLDLRVDKTYHYKRTSVNFYLDLQNVLMHKNESNPSFTFERNQDNTDFITTDGQPIQQDGSNAIPVLLKNKSGRPIPSLGLIVEF